jgi:hypothetical protein
MSLPWAVEKMLPLPLRATTFTHLSRSSSVQLEIRGFLRIEKHCIPFTIWRTGLPKCLIGSPFFRAKRCVNPVALKGGGMVIPRRIPSPLEGEGRVGGAAGHHQRPFARRQAAKSVLVCGSVGG